MLSKPAFVVSYADTDQRHIGYVYQATNWIYSGLSERRWESILIGETKHNRHVSRTEIENYDNLCTRRLRPRKHRYVYFLGSKKDKKAMHKAMKYPILPYPKGESKRYDDTARIVRHRRMF